MFLVVAIAGVLQGLVTKHNQVLSSIIGLGLQIVSFLFQMGALYLGIRRAQDLPIKSSMVFYPFKWNLFLNLVGNYCLQVLIFLPIIILIFVLFILGDLAHTVFSQILLLLLMLLYGVIYKKLLPNVTPLA
ncbi:MAG: hypothetical protein H0W64_04705 [Gammaproteobacteria bacterium]|nr:hypothetical protein [Gammaproteobacteria bacterium]